MFRMLYYENFIITKYVSNLKQSYYLLTNFVLFITEKYHK